MGGAWSAELGQNAGRRKFLQRMGLLSGRGAARVGREQHGYLPRKALP